MSEDLFDLLIRRCETEGVSISEGARWLTPASDFDKALMAKGDVETLILSRSLRCLIITFRDERLLVTSGFSTSEELPPYLSRIASTPASFSIAILHLGIFPSATVASIRDSLEDFSKVSGDYSGHELESVSCLFPPISCFRIAVGYLASLNIERVVGGYIALSYANGPIEISDDLARRFSDLFQSGSEYVPFGLLLHGFLSFSWSGFFLETYRCLEQLYSAPKLKLISEEIATGRSLYELAEVFERILSWRPREDESLGWIIGAAPRDAVCTIIDVLNPSITDDSEKTHIAAAKAIYRLRNESVHFRPVKARTQLKTAEWNALMISMLSVVDKAYEGFGAEFHGKIEV